MSSERQPVALVTGAGRRRIGNYVARALAGRGFRVGLHFYQARHAAEQTEQELRSQGHEVALFQADLSVPGGGRRLIEEVLERFGQLDLLVTCASVWEQTPLERADAEALDRAWRTNVLATYEPAWRAGLQMVAQPQGGCLVLIADWAIVRPYRDYLPYLTAKGAIPTLTRALAVELGTRNPRVRANCILPGPVLVADEMPLEERAHLEQLTLVRRVNVPEAIAATVSFFYENPFVTGAVVPVDGGRTIYAGGA
jgi:pteridine reductase